MSPSQNNSAITAVDPTILGQLGTTLSEASAAIGLGIEVYESIPVRTLSLVLGPVGGEFLAAFDSATVRHRDLLGHVGQCLGAAGELCHASAAASEAEDQSGAAVVFAAAQPGGGKI